MKLQLIDAWNTGAMYTDQGQRIGLWIILDDDAPPVANALINREQYKALYLQDYDRGIDYVIEAPRTSMGRTRSELADYAMHSYLYQENLTSRYGLYDFERPAAPTYFPRRSFG